MAKLKLTRKSYKRNIVVFGLMLFVGIALVSTGFATWVLSQDTSIDASGNVEVGIVEDNALKIEDLEYYTVYNETEQVKADVNNLEFNFEPTKDDTTGRVKNDGINFEQMDLYIVGKVSPITFIDDFNIQLTLPEGVESAIAAGYIALDDDTHEFATKDENGSIVIGANVVENSNIVERFGVITTLEGGYYQFVIHIGFDWGSYFNYQNPGIYYDNDETGKKVKYAEVKIALNNLRSLVHGCTIVELDDTRYELYEIQGETYAFINNEYFKVTLTKDAEGNITNITKTSETAFDVQPTIPTFGIKITVTAK